MKKILATLFTLFIVIQPTFAISFSDFIQDFQINREEKSVERFLNSQIKYANKNNYDKFLSTYDDKYISGDGFSKEIYGELIKSVWDSFKDIKYSITIKSLEVNDNKAKAELIETSFAEIDLNKVYTGELKSISNSIYNIQKDKNGKWKVISDEVINETTTMLYGSAQNIDVKLSAPEKINSNTDYTATLEFVPPEDTIAIASIASDIVEYPQKPTKEVFRPLPEDNILERIFTSNDKNVNEYIIATIGLTKANVSNTNIQLKLTGFGYAIKRVNVNTGDNDDKTK